MLELTFNQTKAELLVRAASTVLFNSLSKSKYPLVPLSQLAEKPQYGFTASASKVNLGTKFVRITDLKDGNIDWRTVPYCECEDIEKYKLVTNDILFARTGATTGKTHLIKEKVERAVFASYLIRIRPKEGVLPEYLYFFFQSNAYWLQISEEKKGSAQPNVNGKKLSNIQIPVVDLNLQLAISKFLEVVRSRQYGDLQNFPELPPPLEEQRRIVARVEELAGKIEEARLLRQGAIKDLDNLLFSKYKDIVEGAKYLPMEKVAPLERRSVKIDPLANYPELGIRSFGKGTFHKPALNGIEVGTKKLYRIEENDLLFQIVFAWEGAVAVAQKKDHGRYGSHRFLTCVPKKDLATSSFLCFHFLTPEGLDVLGKASPGGAGRNRTLGLKALAAIEVPVPSFEKQCWFSEFKAKVDEMKRLREDALKELDAMLPSILDKAFKGEL